MQAQHGFGRSPLACTKEPWRGLEIYRATGRGLGKALYLQPLAFGVRQNFRQRDPCAAHRTRVTRLMSEKSNALHTHGTSRE